MNKFLVLASVLVCISADIGIDLRQGAPTGSYLPQTSHGSGSNSYSSYNGAPHQSSGGYSSGSSNSYHGGVSPGGYNSYSSYGPVAGSSYGSYSQQNVGVPHVAQHRSFFYDAPEDLGETHINVRVQPSAAAGDNTIYIRAPAYNSKVVPHFNIAQQQAAGKTKVYVLVKKPEEQQDIVVPAAAQAPAAKPEVVFVKYTNQKEAEQKIQDIQHGASSGDSAKVVYNHKQLVSSIRDEPHYNHESSYGGVNVNSAPGVVHSGAPGGHLYSSGIVNNYGPAGASGPY